MIPIVHARLVPERRASEQVPGPLGEQDALAHAAEHECQATAVEAAARNEGFGRLQLAATLAGEPLYRAYGFAEIERFTDGGVPLIRMEKRIAQSA